MILYYKRDELPAIIGRFLTEVEGALVFSHGEQNIGMLVDKLLNEKAILWSTDNLELWAVTEIEENFKERRVLVSLVCGSGAMQFLEEFTGILVEYGKSLNCNCIVGYCRPGWVRLLKPIGYNIDRVILRKEV